MKKQIIKQMIKKEFEEITRIHAIKNEPNKYNHKRKIPISHKLEMAGFWDVKDELIKNGFVLRKMKVPNTDCGEFDELEEIEMKWFIFENKNSFNMFFKNSTKEYKNFILNI